MALNHCNQLFDLFWSQSHIQINIIFYYQFIDEFLEWFIPNWNNPVSICTFLRLFVKITLLCSKIIDFLFQLNMNVWIYYVFYQCTHYGTKYLLWWACFMWVINMVLIILLLVILSQLRNYLCVFKNFHYYCNEFVG